MTGIELIAAERQGFTIECDKHYTSEELAWAACSHVMPDVLRISGYSGVEVHVYPEALMPRGFKKISGRPYPPVDHCRGIYRG